MATGGTIPSNRTQSVSFYDTTGIIEKHKGIYFVPNDLGVSGKVNTAYISKFEAICPPSSFYTNISISSWSPQDRTLFVKGNVDDFRLVTEEGECLNYFIVTRNVTKGEGQSAVTKTYYYAFFITGVEQSGGGSIKLTYQADHFTNVFYLHNTDSLPQTDIFNTRLKNCYVKRQHYNRVKIDDKETELTKSLSTQSSSQQTIVLYESQFPFTNFSYTQTTVGSGSCSVDIVHSDKYRIVATIASQEQGVLYGVNLSISFIEKVINPDNIKIFLNQEESFKFKYQYRDFKFPVSLYDGSYSQEEINTINSTSVFTSLSTTLREKILLTCLSFLCIEYKSREGQGIFVGAKGGDYYIGNYNSGNRIGDIYKPNFIVSFPILIVPEYLSKYKSTIGSYKFYENLSSNEIQLATPQQISKALSENAMADKIYGVYLTKDIYLPKAKISFSHSNYKITIAVKNVYGTQPTQPNELRNINLDSQDVYPFPVRKDYNSDIQHQSDYYLLKDYNSGIITYSSDHLLMGILTNMYSNSKFIININENIPDLPQNYYDPVLETEPYKFYSLSYLGGYEFTFNKNRYYEGLSSTINLTHLSEINGALKIGVIPSYTVEGKETLYFNEGLVFTTTSSLPLTSDSYSSFYYQNKAQMKNQFAVNDFNRGMDLLQHFGISGPNAVGYRTGNKALSTYGEGSGAMIGGTALLETANQVMQMADEVIDWAQSSKVIGMNQRALLADVGNKPDTFKQVGSDIYYDINSEQNCYFLNHYNIDELSYNTIAKFLERFGYQVNLYDSLHTNDRVGWNFIMLNSVDLVGDFTVAEEEAIRNIFANGVTLLHNKTYLTSGHNYETILNG